MDRRTLIGLGALAFAPLPALGAEAAAETIPLWPSVPPGGSVTGLVPRSEELSPESGGHDRHISGIAVPTLTVIRPETPDGSAIMIAPGGGYLFEAIDAEGFAPALVLARHGVTAFVLTYRLPAEGWKARATVPLQDAQRAMRLIRARGPSQYGIDPARVGVLGFSAGGHLMASLATKFDAEVYARADEADTLDARPSFAALLYPVITMLAPYAHEASCEKLLGPNASIALRTAYSVERSVPSDAPPTFLCAAADDPDVPVDNTLLMFQSLRAGKVESEMHVFETGGHGFGLGGVSLPAGAWPDLLLRWAESHRFMHGTV